MKRFLLILLASLIACAAHAAPQTMLTKGDVLHGQFTETRRMKGFDGPMTSTGRFTVAPGYGLIWDTLKPFAITTVITPQGLTQSVDNNKVTDLATGKIPFLLHLYDALSNALAGDWQTLEKDFIVARTEANGRWQITLAPRQADNVAMPFSAITVNGNRFAETVHMVRKDGDSEDITFTEQAVSHAAPSSAELTLFGAKAP